MGDSVLWCKQASIVMMLSRSLGVDAEKSLDIFYSTSTYRMFIDSKYGLQLMSNQYIVDDVLVEIGDKKERLNITLQQIL